MKSSPSLTCKSCSEVFHNTCLSLAFTNVKQLAIQNDFKCGNCQLYPERSIQVEDNFSKWNDLKLSTVLPSSSINLRSIQQIKSKPADEPCDKEPPVNVVVDLTDAPTVNEDSSVPPQPEKEDGYSCDKCGLKENTKDNLNAHYELVHKIICDECQQSFDTNESLRLHVASEHEKRGSKRNRSETSLIFDARECSTCDAISKENKTLKDQITSLTVMIDDEKKKVEILTKEKQVYEIANEARKNSSELLSSNETNPKLAEVKEMLKKRNEEYELMKQMVLDRDKTIKKLTEVHQKEIATIKEAHEAKLVIVLSNGI